MRPDPSSTEFKVHRREPELIVPAMPTPREFKPLSCKDDQHDIPTHIPVVQVYRQETSMRGEDPVKVIKEALAEVLVFYYPFAGRLREWPDRKLVVECTGEGVLFVEAYADFDLNILQPPFTLWDEFLFDVPGSCAAVNHFLLLAQVTRLKCGGFVFGLQFNHTIFDTSGVAQFVSAIGEIARGQYPSCVLPVWERQVLRARISLITTRVDGECGNVSTARVPIPPDNLVVRAFFFGPTEISILRRLVPFDLRCCSPFEILAACLWKCGTFALQPNPTSEIRIICVNKLSNNLNPDIIRKGCCGNKFIFSTAVVTAQELLNNPLSYTLRSIRKARINTPEGYVQSVMDTLVINDMERISITSDVRRAGFCEVDFGWDKAMYGCSAKVIPILGRFCASYKNVQGENGFVLPISLPAQSMDRFAKDLENLLQSPAVNNGIMSSPILSSL